MLNILSRMPELLAQFAGDHSGLLYILVFLIIFAETGLVFMPFLPGDSMLFALGALATRAELGLNVPIIYLVIIVGALLGDILNYTIARRWGRRLFADHKKLLSTKHLYESETFFAKYGLAAIVLARFMPIIRTFMPFVAGLSVVPYPRFIVYSLLGAVCWSGVCVTAGLFFGNMPFVKAHFELVILALIGISMLPVLIKIALTWHKSRKHKQDTPV